MSEWLLLFLTLLLYIQTTEANQAEFWTTMAPNVDDYNSSVAKTMAKGTGQIIRKIFWVRDSTVARLESGSLYMKGRVKPNAKPAQISPRALRNVQRYFLSRNCSAVLVTLSSSCH